jgi:type VI secretion system protein ImpC
MQTQSQSTAIPMSLLDNIVDESRVATNDLEKIHARDQIASLVDEVLAGTVTVSRDLAASIDARVADLERVG